MSEKSETVQVKMPSGIKERIINQSQKLKDTIKSDRKMKADRATMGMSAALISAFICMLSPALFVIGAFPFLLVYSSELNGPQFLHFMFWAKCIWLFWLYGSIMALLVSFGLYLVNSREEDCY